MISLAMTTYNGEKYIFNQLESLKNQSMKIDEVIIYDDCSCDKTYKIVEKYIYDNKLSDWRIKKQKNNVGWRKNFYTAIRETTGEYIFFSDQDDVWNCNKIKEMMTVFKENQGINVLCCVADYIDQAGNNIYLNEKSLPFGKKNGERIIKEKFDSKFIYSIMPGCTMAVRKQFVERALMCTYENFGYILPHDALFWKLGVLTDSAYLLNEELISYRIHAENASSPSDNMKHRVKSKAERRREIEQNKKEISIIKNIYCSFLNSQEKNAKISRLDELIEFCKIRNALIANELNAIEVLFSKYMRCYRDTKMFVGDLCAKHSHKGEKSIC